MGLDWCVLPRESDQQSPGVTLGALTVSLDNPDSLKAFRDVYESHQESAQSSSNDAYKAFWTRPFDDVVADRLGSVLVDTATQLPPGHGASSFLCAPWYFRGKILTFNEILQATAFDLDRLYLDHSPDEASLLAGDLANALAESKEPGSLSNTDTWEEAQADLEEAIAWLRFWAERGHGFHAWF